jgi:hypothetical protein
VAVAMQHQVERCDDKLQLQALVVLKAVQFASDVGLVSQKKKKKRKKKRENIGGLRREMSVLI